MGSGDEVGFSERPAAPRQQARDGAGVREELRARRRASVGSKGAQLLEMACGELAD